MQHHQDFRFFSPTVIFTLWICCILQLQPSRHDSFASPSITLPLHRSHFCGEGRIEGNTDVSMHAIGGIRTSTGIRLYTRRRCIINQKECLPARDGVSVSTFQRKRAHEDIIFHRNKMIFWICVVPFRGAEVLVKLLKINKFCSRQFNQVQHEEKIVNW